ncbi:hypothetical protein [Ureaplasma parvum]|uniref:hypothetical protein n=1 Tax=Ureaplasma parvum TaxID=134821 RepID=UPI002FDF760B
MMEKLKNNKTLFLNVEQAQKLGINNPLTQEIFLDDQKLKVHLINSVKDEFYLKKSISKGYAYFNSLEQFKTMELDVLDNYQFAKIAATNLDEYDQLVYTKTRQYLINKEFWTNDGLDAFIGDDFKRKQLTSKEIVNLKTKYDLWIQELHFNNARISKQIHNLNIHGQNKLDYEKFYDKKATLESNLDILQILIYLRSSLLELDFDDLFKDDQNKISIRQLLVNDLEYLPFSFQRYDYESRRNFIRNSRQLVDTSIDFDDLEYDFLHNKTEKQELEKNNESIKIAELKKIENSQLSDEQQSNLEKEFYSVGAINCFDEVSENKQELNKEQSIIDKKIGYLKPRSYLRHHETPFMVDIENRVDFLMAGYEIIKNDDPYAIKQEILKNNILEQQKLVEQDDHDFEGKNDDQEVNEELLHNTDKLENQDSTSAVELSDSTEVTQVVEMDENVDNLIKTEQITSFNDLKQEQSCQENIIKDDLSSIQIRLDEIINVHEKDSKLQTELNSIMINNGEKNIDDNLNNLNEQIQIQDQRLESLDNQNATIEEEIAIKNLNNKADIGVMSVEKKYEPEKEMVDFEFETAENQKESVSQDVLNLNNNSIDNFKEEKAEENTLLTPQKIENNDLSSQIELTPADFELKTQEINDETERLLDELNNNKPRQKKKFLTWFSSKKR